MKVVVVGAGSVGSRHIRNLLSLGVDVSAYRHRPHLAHDLAEEFGICVHDSLDGALDGGQDAVVICNRPDQHMHTALEAASSGSHLFIEKPLSHTLSGVGDLETLVRSRALVVEVGCSLRFHPNLTRIRELISEGAIGKIYHARVWVGQYLPDWRPGTDYRHSYSSTKSQGGGVLLDLVHEFDYLTWWFGPVSQVSAFADKVSDLETDVEDVAQILLRFDSGLLAQVHLDYVRPFFGRGCEIVGSAGTITWDCCQGTVTVQRRGDGIARTLSQPERFCRNEMFLNHMRHFVDAIRRGETPAVSLADGVRVLQIALAARLSSAERRVVRPAELAES